jgi:ABC-type glycerol-3-phosphate transport system substrate-binding protein
MESQLSRRSFLSGVVLAGAGLIVSGCSSSSKPASSPSTGPSGGGSAPISGGSPAPAPTASTATGDLELWNFSSQLNGAITGAFTAAHPKLDVKMVSLSNADLNQRLLVSLGTGSGLPAAAMLSSRNADQFVTTGGLHALDGAYLSPYRGGFDESALIAFGGKTYGVPLGDGRLAMWVRAATLDKYGIDPGTFTTFDAMAEAGRKLYKDSGDKTSLFIMPSGNTGADYFSAFANSAGGNWWDEDGKLVEDQQAALDTLTFLVGLVKDGVAQKVGFTAPSFYQMIKQEQLVGFGMNFAIGANNLPKNVPEQSGQWQMVKWPRWKSDGPDQTASYGETFFAVLEHGGNIAGGEEAATWWLTPDGLPSIIGAFGPVAYKPGASLPEAQKKFPYFGNQAVIAEMMAQPYPATHWYQWSKVEQTVGYAVDKAVLGEMSPAQAIDYCVSGLKKLA